jgi:hypothetical protein
MAVGLMPLGTLLAGVLATVMGIRVTLFLSAVVTSITTFILLFPDVRDPEVLRTSSSQSQT